MIKIKKKKIKKISASDLVAPTIDRAKPVEDIVKSAIEKTNHSHETTYKIDGYYVFYTNADPNNPMRFEIKDKRLYYILKVKKTSKKSSDQEVEEGSDTENPSGSDYIEVPILLLNRPLFVLSHYWDHVSHDSHMHELGYFAEDGKFVAGFMVKDLDVQPTMSGNKVFSELRNMGFVIGTTKPTVVAPALYHYILCQDNVPEGHVIKKIGWTSGDCNVYALQTEVIQKESDTNKYMPVINSKNNAFERAGNIEGWKNGIAKLAVGNPLMIFSICVAIAGPLLRVLNIPAGDDGGFNFYGLHGTGKTTLVETGSTVWGCRETQTNSWSSTTNHFESVAESRNDNVLILDELGRIGNPKDLNKVIYSLAGGDGKGRLDSNANEKMQRKFRILIISTSEKPSSTIAAEAGINIEGGVEDRLASIPANGGKGMGVFSDIHEYDNPADFAQAVKRLTSRDCNEGEANYGVAGPEFIYRIISKITDIPELRERWQSYRSAFLKSLNAENVSRVGSRFALVGFAGELATEFGLTGWEKGKATEAAKYCFIRWHGEHHGTNHEKAIALSKIADHINSTKTTKFVQLNSFDKYEVPDKSFMREIDGFVKIAHKNIVLLHILDHNVVSGDLIELDTEEIWMKREAIRRVSGFDCKVVGPMFNDSGWLTEDSVKGKDFVSRPRIIGPSQTAVCKLNNAFSTLDLENNCWGKATYVYEDSEHRTISLELTSEEFKELPRYWFATSERIDSFPVYAYRTCDDGTSKQVGVDELDEILKNLKAKSFNSATGNGKSLRLSSEDEKDVIVF